MCILSSLFVVCFSSDVWCVNCLHYILVSVMCKLSSLVFGEFGVYIVLTSFQLTRCVYCLHWCLVSLVCILS